MNNIYYYDVEIYSNFFCVTFIPDTVSKELINTYCEIDKQCLEYKYSGKGDIETLLKDKAKILQIMQIRQFVIWIDYVTGKFRNDAKLLNDFFIQHKILYGYNSNSYDQYMIDIFLNHYKYLDVKGFDKKETKHITTILFNHSCACVNFGKGYGRVLNFKRYYKRPFTDYDIQKILYLDKSFTSLKQVGICLKWYRIQNLPIKFNNRIEETDIFNILDYNVNDVLITLTLVKNQHDEILLREDISKEFEIDVRNMSRSSIGKAITTSLYEKFSGIPKKDFINLKTDRWKIKLGNIISDKIKFKTKILNNLLNEVKSSVIVVGSPNKEDKFIKSFKFGDTIYNMALGGLHSKDKPGIIIAGEFAIRDADVK